MNDCEISRKHGYMKCLIDTINDPAFEISMKEERIALIEGIMYCYNLTDEKFQKIIDVLTR